MKTGTPSLFVPGPTNIPEAVRRAIDRPMEDHRAPDLPALTTPLLAKLKTVFRTADGRVMLFPGSGTGGWEAAVSNTLSVGDRVLIARFGQFSHLWVDMCQRLGFEVEVIDVPWGEGVPLRQIGQRLAQDSKHRIRAVLATHNETATGVCSDIGGLRREMDAAGHPALLFVDGVSSIASIDFRMDEWGVDVAVAGSQKGFMLPAGLAIVAVSEKALDASRRADMKRCYFSFDDMAAANDGGYFPYTPPMSLIRGLQVSVDRLLEEGLDNVYRRHHLLAGGVRAAVQAWGLSLCAAAPHWYSDTVSAICVPTAYDANALLRHAYEHYQLSLGGGLGQLSGRVFRIGHLGDLNELMVLTALAGAEMAMGDLDFPVQPGSGVAAAQAHFRTGRERPRLAAAV